MEEVGESLSCFLWMFLPGLGHSNDEEVEAYVWGKQKHPQARIVPRAAETHLFDSCQSLCLETPRVIWIDEEVAHRTGELGT